jgi:hypothetical protein
MNGASMKRSLFGFALALGLLVASKAHAGATDFDLKLGLRGGPNFSILLDPSDSEEYKTVPYPNVMFDLGWNIGGALNMRAWDLIGLEIGAIYGIDSLKGSSPIDNVIDQGTRQRIKNNISFSQSTLHIPIVAQMTLPFTVIRPFGSLGIDLVVNRSSRTYEQNFDTFVVPDAADVSNPDHAEFYRSALAQGAFRSELNEDDQQIYGGFILGAGVTITAPRVEIPLEARIVYYPTTGWDTTDRLGDPAANGLGRCDTTDVNQETSCAVLPPSSPLGSNAAQLRYNDRPQFQILITAGFDYLLL